LADKITPQDVIYLGDFHPNSRVHQLYAAEIARQLIPLLKRTTECRGFCVNRFKEGLSKPIH
jgi:hypothetical protein